HRRRDRMAWAYALITLVFAATTVANMVERPDGLKIAGCFIAAILIVSLVSRVIRAYELRATGITFDETAAGFLREAGPSGRHQRDRQRAERAGRAGIPGQMAGGAGGQPDPGGRAHG